MGVNDTPILFRHVQVLQERHHRIYIYTNRTCEINKVYINPNNSVYCYNCRPFSIDYLRFCITRVYLVKIFNFFFLFYNVVLKGF